MSENGESPQGEATEEAPGQAVATRTLDPIERWMEAHQHVKTTVLDDGRRVVEIDAAIRDKFILVGPVTNLVQADRNWTPRFTPMRIKVGEDSYKVGSVGTGQDRDEVHDLLAPTWVRLGELCGVQYVRSRTERRRDGLKVTVTARKRGPDGNWIPAVASCNYDYDVEAELLEIDMRERWEKWNREDWEKKQAGQSHNDRKAKPPPTDTEIRKTVLRQRQFAERSCETKAKARCVKTLTGLRSFRRSVLLDKPFMSVNWLMSPDLNDPGSLQLVKMQFAESVADLYGDDGGPALLGPGTEYVDVTEVVHEHEDSVQPDIVDGRPIEDQTEDEEAETVEGEVVEGKESAPAEAEEWDMGEDEPAQEAPAAVEKPAEKPAKPTHSFQPKAGPFAGKRVEEIIETADGRKWLVGAYGKLRQAEKKQELLDWLSFAAGKPITAENINDAIGA